MNAIKRREEIMRILIVRRHETMQVLAAEFGVTDRTIRNDITILTAKYPLETSRDVGGGVSIPYSFHSYKNILSMEQVNVLEELMPKASIHRVSQTENCLYIYLIAKNSVDAKILRSLRDKVDLARMLVDDYRNGIDPFQEMED